MTQVDRYEHGLSTDVHSAEQFLNGLDHALSFDNSGISALEQSVAADPNFALGFAMLGRQQQIHGQRPLGTSNLNHANNIATNINARERSTIGLLQLSASNQSAALKGCMEHLRQWPTDVIVFSLIIGPFGLLAASGRRDWREANLELMLRYKNQWPENDWWFLANLAFSEVEIGDVAKGLTDAQKSFDLHTSGTAIHSISHAQVELGLAEEGLIFARDWLAKEGLKSDMRHHIVWHSAIFEYDLDNKDIKHLHGKFNTELSSVVSDPMPLSTFSDNASFLWRMQLKNVALPTGAVDETMAYMDKHFGFTGFHFADIHRICIIALSKDNKRMQQLLKGFSEAAFNNNATIVKSMPIFCEAFFAFAKRDYTKTVLLLEPIVEDSVLLGGSNPQRRIVSDTLDAAKTLLTSKLNSGGQL